MDLFAQVIFLELGIHDPDNFNVDGGLDVARQLFALYRTAFPDIQFTVEDPVAEGEMVVTRWSARGTHLGTLRGIPPTGKQVTVTGMLMEHYSDRRPRRSWMNWDGLGSCSSWVFSPHSKGNKDTRNAQWIGPPAHIICWFF